MGEAGIEALCELDPVTWDAMIDAMKDNGVSDAMLGAVCAQALATINATPVAVRDEWLATGVKPSSA
ncbi:hypothetical protein [Streptomyces sp. NBC_01465]|uniref:hypothetical protein n=1 Tax=Streptomyces sp. NBC_01465 TaxID=2903878 RepID=UPI002E3019DA|nr:hypothetical protein [Streptomyces sp. NBC_01465]